MQTELLILFLIKHFMVDFVLQTEYQWKNKGTFLHPGGLLHCFLHGLFTFVILTMFGLDSLFYATIDALSHYSIDFTKSNINKRFELSAESEIFWVLVGIDQLLHYLVYIFIIF